MAKKAIGLAPNRVSMVAEGTVLEGALRAEGDVWVSGRIVGTVTVEARMVVASAGVIDGEVVAAEADVAGCVQGDLDVAGCLSLRGGACVDGSVKAGKLVVEEGAVFNGACRMVQAEAPPVPLRQHSGPKRESRALQAGSPPSGPPVPKTVAKASSDEAKASSGSSGNGKGFRRAGMAVLGIVLVVMLASGTYYGFEVISEAVGNASGPTVQRNLETGETLSEVEVASDDIPDEAARYSVSETPAHDPADFAAPIDAAQQAAGLDRITMERTRQTVLNRSAEPEAAALYQQAETTRQGGMRQFEAGHFEQAADSFRLARDLFIQIKQRLDDKDRALVLDDSPDAVTEDRADAEDLTDATEQASPDPVEQAPSDPVETGPEEDPDGTLEEVRTVVGRLARQLKVSVEREDATGMQALFYRGWTPFFDEADAISAAVRYENVQRSGAEVTAEVYLDLAYQDEDQQPQQRIHAYVWTLMRLADEWVLRQVASR